MTEFADSLIGLPFKHTLYFWLNSKEIKRVEVESNFAIFVVMPGNAKALFNYLNHCFRSNFCH